jgi:undecaprenyl diphosphate synthase
MELKAQIDLQRLPKHIAIIMDGNGRWAKKQGKLRVFGHQHGVAPVKYVAEAGAELGVEFVTLYAFSKENWSRPQKEVDALMSLLVKTINKEIKTLQENNIRLRAIGDLHSLPQKTQQELQKAIDATSKNTRMTLVLALSYGSRWEILEAVKSMALKFKEGGISESDFTETIFDQHLNTADFPDPELMIRTSGEQRISNFLLWQLAYSELYFTEKLWPDFTKEDFYHAIIDFQSRERRYGKTSEQLQEK